MASGSFPYNAGQQAMKEPKKPPKSRGRHSGTGRRESRPPGGSLLRELPQVAKMLHWPEVKALVGPHPRAEVVRMVRETLGDLRREILSGENGKPPGPGKEKPSHLAGRLQREAILSEVRARLERSEAPAYRRAVNATGIILHTGLGRAVYSREARAAMAAATAGYSVVEIDPSTGERNLREVHLAGILRELTGAGAATVVNNNAGATLIILAALARGKEVIVSHGQLVEIGGAYRIPDVMKESGARLVAVGTTNRTYLHDYRSAIGPDTGLLLQVHTSNYEITGFARHTPLEELVELGREHRIPVVSDLGSGCFVDLSPHGFRKEPLVADSVRAGADLVCFSGDKLLGGPQAGVIVGKREAVERVRRHPLFRALRVDKAVLAGLEATLRLYRDPKWALQSIPPLRMITTPESLVRRRAASFARKVKKAAPGVSAAAVRSSAQTGSGSLPAQDLPSWAVALELKGLGPGALAAALRSFEPPVFARISEGKVLLDFRTILPDEEKMILVAVESLRK
jgi:L-seryl-tRNA(Ser) seleniumtransferase